MKNVKPIIFLVLVTIFITTCKKEEPNTPPVADFTISPEQGNTETIFIFDASLCADIDESVTKLEVRWDWENDGIWDTDYSTNKTIEHQFYDDSLYTVVLEVRDSKSLSDTITKQVAVVIEIPGLFTDLRDWARYKYVIIGNQTWMAENLYYETKDGSWCYENNPINSQNFGRYYTWTRAVAACPPGWHLPDDNEWKELERFLGMSTSDSEKTKWRTSGNVGLKLKSDRSWWGSGNNESGFNAGAYGYRMTDGTYYGRYNIAEFWTASSYPDGKGWSRWLSRESAGVYRITQSKTNGLSVRCVKNV